MKRLIFLLPIFLFAGINNSYAFKKGYQEGLIIKRMSFGKIFNKKEINKKCLNVWKKDSIDNYIKQNRDIFLKGCKEALESF